MSPSFNHQVKFLTLPDVVKVDGDVLVAVAAALLVVEAQRVQQLVLHHAVLHAAEPLQGNHLLVPRTPDGRVAPGDTERGITLADLLIGLSWLIAVSVMLLGMHLELTSVQSLTRFMVVSPVFGFDAEVHPLLGAGDETDAGPVVELLHSVQHHFPLDFVCKRNRGEKNKARVWNGYR